MSSNRLISVVAAVAILCAGIAAASENDLHVQGYGVVDGKLVVHVRNDSPSPAAGLLRARVLCGAAILVTGAEIVAPADRSIPLVLALPPNTTAAALLALELDLSLPGVDPPRDPDDAENASAPLGDLDDDDPTGSAGQIIEGPDPV